MAGSIIGKKLPPGVSIVKESGEASDCRVTYMGTDAALLAAGLLRPEWVEILGKRSVSISIALTEDGGFLVTGEGRGRHCTDEQRKRGAFLIRRICDGVMRVSKLRTREKMAAAHKKRLAKRDAELAEWEAVRKQRQQSQVDSRGSDDDSYEATVCDQRRNLAIHNQAASAAVDAAFQRFIARAVGTPAR